MRKKENKTENDFFFIDNDKDVHKAFYQMAYMVGNFLQIMRKKENKKAKAEDNASLN